MQGMRRTALFRQTGEALCPQRLLPRSRPVHRPQRSFTSIRSEISPRDKQDNLSVKTRSMREKQQVTVSSGLDMDPSETQQASPSSYSADSSVQISSWWDALPARYKLVIGCAASFIVCNMDKVNISIAIIPMAADFGWSPSVSGVVQSSFFYGYMFSQVPGGILASKFGGRRVLPAGLGICSLATAGVPLLATTIPGLCISRAAVGMGEAIAPSAATDIIARIIPSNERSRAVSFIFSGLHFGSILGLLAAPPLISNFGWESVFVCFGLLGFVWYAWFEGMVNEVQRTDPDIAALLVGRASAPVDQQQPAAPADPHGGTIDADMPIPWRAFLRSRPVQALMYTHFCNNWFHYTMLAWLPTYFTDTLSVDLMHAAQTALLPPLAGVAASAAAGPLADSLVSQGVALSTVRKLAQGTAFLVPSAFLLWACTPDVMDSTNLTVASITLALGISSFSLAGLYCTHQDLSPKYAPAMLGLTNTAGAFPGILGVTTVGVLYDATQSWELALFVPSAVFMLSGVVVYTLFCSNSQVDFDAADNQPFGFESWLGRLRSGFSGGQDESKR